VRRFEASVWIRNLTAPGEAVDGRSVSALSTLGVLAGHHVEVSASGRQAREAVAAVSALVRRNFDEAVTGARLPEREPGDGAQGVSAGIGMGPKTTFGPVAARAVAAHTERRGEAGPDQLLAAIDGARAELHSVRDRVARTAGEAAAQIFDAQSLLLDDEQLVGKALALLEESDAGSAESAWQQSIAQLAERFAALPDPYQKARAQDVRDVGERVIGHLRGTAEVEGQALTGVVVVDDLTPAQAAELDPAEVSAVVAARGTAVSHGVILARSLGIPMVIGAGAEVLAVPDGTLLLVDGSAGTVIVDPDPARRAEFEQAAAAQSLRAESLLHRAHLPAITADGLHVEVVANIASVTDAEQAVERGADGVGLLRTEFLFLDRQQPPGEEEQREAYVEIAKALRGRRLTIRTLDVGGDKQVPYLPAAAEENPFLGQRGLRLSLQFPDLFAEQLRAIVRTGLEFPVTVLFPMVTTVDELRSARSLLAKVASDVGCLSGQLPPAFQVGVMAEVPAFAIRARAASPLVDLISIGSNDLTQYTTAAERGNPFVASLADPLDPAVLSLVAAVCRGATGNTRVAVCGELASDPHAAALLVGLGVRELSMTPRAIPEIKERIRRTSAQDARHLAELALQRDSGDSVRALLQDLN
jgi:phosphocarrier protein FPr